MSMLFTDIKLVGFFSNIPLNWPLTKNQAHHRAGFIIRLPSRY